MLKSLYNEHISSNSTFDKTAKKIIRSHYKVIFEKQVEKSQINSEENNKSDWKDNPSSTEASPFASDGKYTGRFYKHKKIIQNYSQEYHSIITT